MAYKTFAAIDVGSNEISMKIFQIIPRKGYKQLDAINSIIEIGSDTYDTGRIREESLKKVCEILNKFKIKMDEYGVTEYRAYASSAVREAENSAMVLERIKNRTGLDVVVLSNSEQRFMNYKAFAALPGSMDIISKKNSALLDIGAGSLQISVFDKMNLEYTQNIPIGAVRIRDFLTKIGSGTTQLEIIMQEYVSNFIVEFKNKFLNEKDLKTIIAIGDGITNLKKAGPELDISDRISNEQFKILYKKVVETTPDVLSDRYGIPYERATLMLPMAIIYKSFLDNSRAEEILTPAITFGDGIVADYMDKKKILQIDKDFDQDIISSACSIAKRYKANKIHYTNVAENALAIFDSTKRIHKLGARERLQLQIACILHNCGKFLNMKSSTVISYYITLTTEILGLSHQEREEIANIIKYNLFYLPSKEKTTKDLNTADYMTVAKLSAILRLADTMDKSHKQKIKEPKIRLNNDTLTITTDSMEDIALEAGLFPDASILFEKVYGIKPILKQKRGL